MIEASQRPAVTIAVVEHLAEVLQRVAEGEVSAGQLLEPSLNSDDLGVSLLADPDLSHALKIGILRFNASGALGDAG
ncbi:MAG: hypothetical protein NZ953_04230 [Thaumarchaeota archaeon]|nr:hypothetical protein [Candidatus Calditenuaceae archaeon]